MEAHAPHHQPQQSLNRLAASATTHCLTGCAIGEVLGIVIGTALGPVLPLAFWAGVGAVGREALGSSLHGGRLLLMLVGLAALGLFLGVVGRRVRRALAGMGLDLAGDPS